MTKEKNILKVLNLRVEVFAEDKDVVPVNKAERKVF